MKTFIFYIVTVSFIFIGQSTFGQKYAVTKSNVSFYSHTNLEDIKATNSTSIGLVDVPTHSVAFSILIKDFVFDQKLMQEHFNEKYMESEKYPRSTFQGKIEGFDVTKKGVQAVKAKGKLTMHGVTKEITIAGNMGITSENSLSIVATFNVKLQDYQIKIPQILWQSIAEEIEIKVDFVLYRK